jgi:ribose-phosphate pyrophosphokinase
MRILQGTSNPSLAENLSQILDAPSIDAELRRFPDGELYCRLFEDIRGEEVILVQSTYPDHNALEYIILSGLLKDQGAKTVLGVIPYFGYARQDRVFKEGESFTARTMSRHIQMSTDHVICVNLHKEAILREFTGTVSASNVSVMGVIGQFLRNSGVDFVLSPDKGAIGYAEEAAEAIGCGYDNLEKTRVDGRTVVMTPKELHVEGRNVAIVDDIIATGGTIMRAQETLRGQGAGSVIAACTHGLFTGGGLDRLRPILDGLFSSDTIENPTSSFSAGAPVAEAVRRIIG